MGILRRSWPVDRRTLLKSSAAIAAVQFSSPFIIKARGLDKQMAVGGALFELESIRAVPDAARVGWWTMEWWWDQPGVPHVAEFNTAIKKITGSAATARNWFGYASVQTLALIANQEKSLDAI